MTRNTLKRRALQIAVLLSGILLAVAIVYAWGATAHHFINRKAVIHLPASMNSWKADSLFYDTHATDPDTRRDNSDTTFGAEQWRHYIDIDDYPNWQNLPHNINTVMSMYGYETVKTTGMVPWAIGWVMDSLTAQLARGDNATAKQTAADLGHYVADSHQPLHVTANYNGQFTGNSGIHSRYETTMINTFSSSLTVYQDSIHYVSSPVDFAFDYIYEVHQYVDSIFDADDYAKTASGWNGSGTPPGTYYDALWAKTGPFTLSLIQRATTDLACLWYTAYVNANQPKFASADDSINFGDLLIGAFKKDSISITNTGTALLHIDSVTSNNNEFTVTPETTSINPSQSKKFYITFTPQNTGTRIGTLTIAHNASGSPKTVSLRGNGLLTAIDVAVNARWNLISNPLTTTNDSVVHLYPSSLFTYAYAYSSDSGYTQRTQLQNGSGYWEKFPSNTTASVMGLPTTLDSVSVVQGWNLIGSISEPVLTSSIVPVGTIILSQYYSYNSGYREADTIIPGKGYWIKVGTSGKLVLSSSATAQPKKEIEPVTGRFTIIDADGNNGTLFFTGYDESNNASYKDQLELPPSPPLGIFDLRFSSNKSIAVADKMHGNDYPIIVSSAHYPITIRWGNNTTDVTAAIVINNKELALTSSGEATISDPTLLALRLSSTASGVPEVFALKQNFPNPFNPATRISYSIQRKQNITLKIFDLLGREIATLVDQQQTPGLYEITWDAGACESGVYFYRLQTENFTDVKKMVLIK